MTGIVHPDEILTNAGGRPGDALVLTKPLGAGAVSTAVKRGLPDPPLAEAIEVMTTLNRDAAAAARAAGAHALTDVTGFGLLGHLHELALASGLAAEVQAAAVPATSRRPRPARDTTTGRRRRHPPQPRLRRDVRDLRAHASPRRSAGSPSTR